MMSPSEKNNIIKIKLRNLNEFNDAIYFLENDNRRDLIPVWTRRDDLMMLVKPLQLDVLKECNVDFVLIKD
jgi:hypothetical protein